MKLYGIYMMLVLLLIPTIVTLFVLSLFDLHDYSFIGLFPVLIWGIKAVSKKERGE